jgi:hypothetical protein
MDDVFPILVKGYPVNVFEFSKQVERLSKVLDVVPERGISSEIVSGEVSYMLGGVGRSDKEWVCEHVGFVVWLENFAAINGLPVNVAMNYFCRDSTEAHSLEPERLWNYGFFSSDGNPWPLRINHSLSVETGSMSGVLRSFRLQVEDPNSYHRDEHTDYCEHKVSSIEAIAAGIIGIILLGLSIWLICGGGDARWLIRLLIFYLCFVLSGCCLLVVDRYACQK